MSLRIKEEELELVGFDGGGEGIYNHNGKPFTGVMIDFHKNGKIAYESEYKNGYIEGLQRFFYETGQLDEEYILSNNVVVTGSYKKYNENGSITGNF